MPNSNSDILVRCPKCKGWIMFWNRHSIDVNIESNGEVYDKGMNFLMPLSGCINPFCEWSRVKIK